MSTKLLEERLERLREKFNEKKQGKPSLTPINRTVDSVIKEMRLMMEERPATLCVEATELLKLSGLLQERVSLLLRFRPEIFGENAQTASAMIFKDISSAVEYAKEADNTIELALTFNPQMDIANLSSCFNEIMLESKRLVTGIMQAAKTPFTPEESAAFHSIYETPDDPLFSYNQKTQDLAEQSKEVAHAIINRIDFALDKVDFFHLTVIPTFPRDAKGMKGEVKKILSESQENIAKVDAFIQQANVYREQLIPQA